MFLNNSSIPEAVQADVSLNTAPISDAYFLASASGTSSLSNKSLLFAANPITIYIKIINKKYFSYLYFLEHSLLFDYTNIFVFLRKILF